MIIPDRIVRSRRKTLSVSVDALGRITVRAPLRYPQEKIDAFLAEKEGWICKHRQRMTGAGVRLPDSSLDGYGLLLLGETYRISLVEGKRVQVDEANKRLFVPKSGAEKNLTAWLKETAKRIFSAAVAIRAKELGVQVNSLKISSARTRWGTCSAKNDIRLCFRLLYAPKEVIDYVIVHELSHVKIKNHSAAFWAQVASVLPDYKQKRKWLKDRPALMQIF